ncbi:MAG: hypothetical protein Q9P14_02105 [candidate division KSB1 bacterium]|nr:hypothetical protein [candidate division KSB1 bacterium]MDQ7065508.1 hypothetical protein [candidate division KSB1 bacterium]
MKTIEYHENLHQAIKYRLDQIKPLTYENCVRAELPAFLLNTIKPQIERLFDREKPLLVKRPDRFDFQNPQLKTELARLKRILLAHYWLQPDEVHAWIRQAIRITADVFIAPFATLPRVVANGQRVHLPSLHAYLQQFPFDYPLKHSLSEIVRSLDAEEITVEHFGQILGEIRYQLYNENMLSVFLQDLDALKALYQWLTGGDIEVFSHAMILRMFEDRGVQDMYQVLQKETVSAWSIQDIQNFVERYLLVGGLEKQEGVRESLFVEENVGELVLDDFVRDANGQQQVMWEAGGELSLIHNSRTDDDNDLDLPERDENMTEKVPQEKTSLQSGDANLAGHEESPVPLNVEENGQDDASAASLDPQDAAPEEEKTDEFDQEIVRGYRTRRRVVVSSENPVIDREKLEEQPPGPYPSLYTFMDQKTRKVFIKKLFGNDEEAFEAFVEKVDHADSWKEAKAIFDAELTRRNINIYSKNAIKLSDFLFSRYFSKNRY